MDDSNKSKLFTFGKLENTEDSDSEKSLSDSTDEDAVSMDRGKGIAMKPNENHQELAKETEKLSISDLRPKYPVRSSKTSSTANYDFYKRRDLRDFDGSDTAAAQLRPKYEHSERHNLFGLGQRLKGNWTLRCDDQKKNSDGLTEADIAWEKVKELHEKEAGILTLRPYKCYNRAGFTAINIYTPDYRDEELVLKVADLIREHVYFPYIMYYHSSSTKYGSMYMHTPNGEFYIKDEKNCWVLLNEE